MYRLSAWQRFWRLEIPYAMPNLVWNMMMSVSAGWFFVVASEAITVSGQTILLPGVGSYIAVAIAERDLAAIGYALLCMLIVILLYDQLLFRPLLAWSRKFLPEEAADEVYARPWFLDRRAARPLLRFRAGRLERDLPARSTMRCAGCRAPRGAGVPTARPRRCAERVFDLALRRSSVGAGVWLVLFIRTSVSGSEIGWVFLLGAITAVRVMVLIMLASLIWVPIGVWIGLRPDLAERAQPIVQFLAAFPANLFFPVAVVLILRYRLNPEIWLSPLMILGTQWYILFNVIAGTTSLPRDLQLAASNLGLRRLLWWRRLILPAIFPAYVTGAVTAAGGSWNASIVSEVVHWGDTTLHATGIGAYIARYTAEGDAARIALGIGVLCLYVLAFNRLLWRRLYDLAAERLRLD